MLFILVTPSPSNRPCPCPVCGKVLTSRGNMKKHVENVHYERPIEEWEPCTECDRRFKTRNLLLIHLVQKHGIYQTRPRVENVAYSTPK